MALSQISGTTGIANATITSIKLADFAAAVDLNGVELILDADQDTSITADTDDRIDLKIGGASHLVTHLVIRLSNRWLMAKILSFNSMTLERF